MRLHVTHVSEVRPPSLIGDGGVREEDPRSSPDVSPPLPSVRKCGEGQPLILVLDYRVDNITKRKILF